MEPIPSRFSKAGVEMDQLNRRFNRWVSAFARFCSRVCTKNRNKGNRNEDNLLPYDMMVLILSRLPVRSLLRFKLVCKSLNSLISSPEFVDTHLRIQSSQDAEFVHYKFILSIVRPKMEFKVCHVNLATPGELSIDVVDVDHPRKDSVDYVYMYVVGSCNGLVCVAETMKSYIHLWNPSTRKSRKLPDLVSADKHVFYTERGFGYGSSLHDYKVVALLHGFDTEKGYGNTRAFVYTLKTNSWKRIEDFPWGHIYGSGTFVNGELYWLFCPNTSRRLVIVSLNLTNETYGELMLPKIAIADLPQGTRVPPMTAIGGFLCVLTVSVEYTVNWQLWMMKRHDMKGSWTKEIKIPCSPFAEHSQFQHYGSYKPLCVSSKGEILSQLYLGSVQFVLYNSQDNKFKCSEFLNPHSKNAHVYVESLVSPYGNIGNGWVNP